VRCPFCTIEEDKVIDSRMSKDGREIRRRRECDGCSRRFTTYERVEESMPQVVKRDGRREPFDRNKIERGIIAAAAKRSVSLDQVKALAEDVEREISELAIAEMGSREIGERVLLRLRGLDHIAYVRFASIYRDFDDLEEFAKEVDLLREAPEGDTEGAELGDGSGARRLGDATDPSGAPPSGLSPVARRRRTDTEAGSEPEHVPDPTLETQPVSADAEPSGR
jgi:transcriptional repressor NrdR